MKDERRTQAGETWEPEGRTMLISAGRPPLKGRLRELWQYRDLVLLLAKKTFIIRYKQTVLGVFWALLRPLISALVLSLAFGRIVGVSTGGIPGLLYYLCSYGLWGFFAETVRVNAGTFTDNAPLFGKVYFPRLAMPLSNLLVSLLTYGIQMLLLLALLLAYVLAGKVQPRWELWLLLPLLLIHLGMLGMSIGVIVSSLTTKYRDLALLVDFAIQLWMFVSPVVYPMSAVQGPALRRLLYLNPVTAPMELFRLAFLGQGSFSAWALLFSLTVTILLAIAAQRLFFRIERDFMDTV